MIEQYVNSIAGQHLFVIIEQGNEVFFARRYGSIAQITAEPGFFFPQGYFVPPRGGNIGCFKSGGTTADHQDLLRFICRFNSNLVFPPGQRINRAVDILEGKDHIKTALVAGNTVPDCGVITVFYFIRQFSIRYERAAYINNIGQMVLQDCFSNQRIINPVAGHHRNIYRFFDPPGQVSETAAR